MTIKNTTSPIKKILTSIKKHKEIIQTLSFIGIFSILLIILIFNVAHRINHSDADDYEQEAFNLIRKGYPTLICLSPNGQFRLYESKTYSISRNKKNGWNVWDTDKGNIPSASFHISRCQIK